MTKLSIVQPSPSRLARMEDQTLSDALSRPGRGEAFWKSAAAVYPSRNRRLVRLRLDPEVVDWFANRRDDPREGFNAVLRAHIEAKKAEV